MRQNRKAKSTWGRLYAKRAFHRIVDEHRQEYGIPPGGFNDQQEFLEWKKEQGMETTDLTEALIEKLSHTTFGVEIKGLEKVIEHYALYGKQDKVLLSKANMTDCELIHVKEGEANVPQMEAGYTYIKVGPKARLADVKEFLSAKKGFLDLILTQEKTRHRSLDNPEREYWAVELDAFDTAELEKIAGFKSYRNVMISSILNRMKFRSSPDIVRKILERNPER